MKDQVDNDDNFQDDYHQRKKSGEQKRKNLKKHKEAEKRIRRVGGDKSRWRFNPKQYDGEDDDYFEEKGL
jgi:hypothetical protein